MVEVHADQNVVSGAFLPGLDDIERSFKSEYIVESNDISFSITFEDLNLRFVGIVTSGATVLSGEVQIIDESTDTLGTFILFLIID